MPTKIQWTDETWNPLRARRRDGTGKVGWACVRVSPGCVNCYAAAQNRAAYGQGTGLDYTVPDLAKAETFLDERVLEKPLHWRQPRRVFVCSMTDLFGEWVSDGQIARVWNEMAQAGQHVFQVLTKRPERMREWATRWADLSGESSEPKLVRGPAATRAAHPSGRGQLFAAMLEAMGTPPRSAAYPTFDWMEGPRWWPTSPPPNVWLGTSVEDQQRAEDRIPHLLATPAAVRFISAEPLLGQIKFKLDWFGCDEVAPDGTWLPSADSIVGIFNDNWRRPGIHWVIVGGESGPRARPMDLAWARSLVAQCKAAGVAVFVKQLGAKPFEFTDNDCYATTLKLRDHKGGDPAEWPEDLQVREWPK